LDSPLSLGPGPLSVARRGAQVHLAFSASKPGAGATPMALEGDFPVESGEVVLELAGGPVALPLLGVTEGAAGLTDVEHATVAGKARAVLAAGGSNLTFDGELRVHGLALKRQKIAAEVVHAPDFSVIARGTLDDQGELRLDDAEWGMGAMRIRARGGLQQASDHVAASLAFDVPAASCQSLLDSVPDALLPLIRSARMTGSFGARGRVAFDTRHIEDLLLDYDIDDRCRVAEVSPDLARERFTHAFTHTVYKPDGKTADEIFGPGTENWTDLDRISPYMQVAVLTTEDGAFPHHKGFNHAAIRNSLIANIKSRRFVRGASTITMQLAKNLFLSRDKTLSRKLEEVILADYLEQIFKKDDMMELYLNVIEFGPDVYGITQAADHYFGRKPEELNLAECLFLSSIMPSPIRYHRIFEKGEVPEAWMKHIRQLMEIAEKVGNISKAELAEGLSETVVFHKPGDPAPAMRAPVGGGGRVDREPVEDVGWTPVN
jgi:hypothetical protein